MKKKSTLYILFFIIYLLQSCANIQAPLGGNKDTTPPQILTSFPDSNQINFSSEKILFAFDEYVEIKDAGKILFSPPIDFTTKIVGKKIELIPKTPFEKNTTYQLSFLQGAIVDYREGNPMAEKNILFSTGAQLDKSNFSVSLYDALSQEYIKDAWVVLVKDRTDFEKGIFQYTAMSNAEGQVLFQNVKPANYFLYAFVDKNTTKKYDDEAELVGFSSSEIVIDTTAKNETILLFESIKKAGIASLNQLYPGAVLLSTKGVFKTKPTISSPLLTSNDLVIQNKTRDSFWVYYQNTTLDKTTFYLKELDQIIDSTDIILKINTKIDTVDFINKLDKKMVREGATDNIQVTKNEPLLVSVDRPIRKINTSKIQLLEDSKPLAGVEYKHSIKQVSARYTWNELKKYTLVLADSALVDIWGNFSKKMERNIEIVPMVDKVHVSYVLKNIAPQTSFIFQVLGSKNQVEFQEIISASNTKNSLKIETDLLPNAYKIRLIEDTNQNGKWDAGNLQTLTMPEKVRILGSQTIKKNLDAEMEIEIK